MFSYANAIFNRALDTIEEHQKSCPNQSKLTAYKQALDWWDNQPNFVQYSLKEHSNIETLKDISDFYWGETS